MFGFGKKQKRSLENPQVPISSANIIQFFGLDEASAAGELVSVDTAMGVPAIWDAVNFLSGTLAGLPLHVYKKTEKGRERVEGGIADLLHGAVNDEMSSFDWRKDKFDKVFTGGRAVSFIERNLGGRIINLWPLDPDKITYKKAGLRRTYSYKDGNRTINYAASDVIDLPFLLKSDRITHVSPILKNADVIGMALAATKYASRFFAGGGVPPFAIEGPFQSPGAMQRASEDLTDAVAKAAKEKRQALTLPAGHTIKNIGVDPSKSQLVELQRFLIEQIARIYAIPPIFLQDLTNGTYSNSEQQDLHFVKHTIKRWVEQFEQELNLKLFGRNNNAMYVELNVDGLLRGDFKTRMEGYAQGVQNAVLKPNEARRRENLPDDENGNSLMIQGATVPAGTQPTNEDNTDDD